LSPISYILPVLTVVSLFLYVFSAERAWLPKAGTTEWITRASTPKRMTADIKFDIKWKDVVIALAIAIVYGGLLVLANITTVYDNIISIICTSLFVGIIYLTAYLLFKNRGSALFAAAITVSDLFLLKTFDADYALLCLLAIFALMTLLASYKTTYLIFAGISLGFAVFLEPSCAFFALLPLTGAVISAHNCKSARPLLMYLLFAVVLPAVIYFGFSYAIYGNILLVHTVNSFALPVFFNIDYCFIAAVCFIFAVIHIFKDKSFTALFAVVGLVLSAAGMFFGSNIVPLFSGLTSACLADIIIKRGKTTHKVFCIIFGAVMLIPVLFCAVDTFISIYII